MRDSRSGAWIIIERRGNIVERAGIVYTKKSRDEGWGMRDEIKAFKRGKYSFHPSSLIPHPYFYYG
jgi:hypothetical protein